MRKSMAIGTRRRKFFLKGMIGYVIESSYIYEKETDIGFRSFLKSRLPVFEDVVALDSRPV